jgi:hypothetical protein
MKPHPRIRKAIKWGGAVVTVLLVVVWIVSLQRWFERDGPSLTVSAHRGSLVFVLMDGGQGPPSGWGGGSYRKAPAVAWGWSVTHPRSGMAIWTVPFWCPTLVAAIGTVVAWRLDAHARRRARQSLCPKCHYDRAGIAAGAKCPECGSAAP